MLVTFVSYSRVFDQGFVNYDDDTLIYENPHILQGVTQGSIYWALLAGTGNSTADTDYWRPLSIISTLVDVQCFGLQAGYHHFVSVLIHGFTAVLLLLMLRFATGSLWRSAAVASLFSIHPLHVESVSWAAERKDVLCGFFLVASLWTYVFYARRRLTWFYYAAVIICCGLALASKPMAVTIPFLLLLMDYWPLDRLEITDISSWRKCLLEKLPLFAMSAGCSFLATRNPRELNSELMNSLSIPWRLGNAVVSYAVYLKQTFWPFDLSVFYPHPGRNLSLLAVGASSALLAFITFVVILQRARRYLTVGWFWYIGMLIPVIGVVQSGLQARADRYTYLPLIGIFLMLVWTAGEWAGGNFLRRTLLWILGGLVLASLVMITRLQTAVWSTSETLWKNALRCDPNNSCAEYNLGSFYLRGGHPNDAIIHYERALGIDPGLPSAYCNLGEALRQVGRLDAAITSLQRALELNPNDADAENNLANTIFQKGSPDLALPHYKRAVQLDPSIPEAHNMIGTLELMRGNQEFALSEFQKAREIRPQNITYANNVAWILATSPNPSLRDAKSALMLAQKNSTISGGQPATLRTLAAAQAAVKNYSDALVTASRAMELAKSQENSELSRALLYEITLYQAGKALGQ